ncbi:uncharacterized protein VTP21DRAFT_2125 [Calcarisporiella thermophila]|uniref:uncharacterized protein n=1 Tax=Calcarisporiella thermophila TaxID=911321 RepID=UPI00374445F5
MSLSRLTPLLRPLRHPSSSFLIRSSRRLVGSSFNLNNPSNFRHILPLQRIHGESNPYKCVDHCRFTSTVTAPLKHDYRNISFYQFASLPADILPSLRLQMLSDLESMGVVGRIYIAEEGINAQISCPTLAVEKLREYCDGALAKYFDNLVFNYATSHEKAFKKLHVRVRHQVVADGLAQGSYDIKKQPIYLNPEQWHKEIKSSHEKGRKPILIDMRNQYESDIGHFEGAIRPKVATFRDGIKAMEEICKGKEGEEIYMYCTGGIRCSKAGAILRSKGFENVRMLRGGITAYGNYVRSQPGLQSLYHGKNFTFDKRLGEPITDEVLGRCYSCGAPCDVMSNCRNAACNLLFVQCDACKQRLSHTCGEKWCLEVVQDELGEKLEDGRVNPGVPCFRDYPDRVLPERKTEMTAAVIE